MTTFLAVFFVVVVVVFVFNNANLDGMSGTLAIVGGG